MYATGLRCYTPDLGRWINRDPIGEMGGINIHCFVLNRSINAFDEFGLLFGSCTVKSGPTLVEGAEWELAGTTLGGEAANNMFNLRGGTAKWVLEGEVECCCRFLIWKRTKTKRVYKTVETDWTVGVVPMTLFSATTVPADVPNPVTIAQGIGTVIAAKVGDALSGMGLFGWPKQIKEILDWVNATKPSSQEEGSWPEEPCK